MYWVVVMIMGEVEVVVVDQRGGGESRAVRVICFGVVSAAI